MKLGIDLGGTKTEIIVLDTHLNQVVIRKRFPTPKNNYQEIVSHLVELVKFANDQLTLQLSHQHSINQSESVSIGIGIPGAISPATGLIKNANTTCLIGKNFKHDLESQLKQEVRLANDADCFTWSEYIDGAGQSFKSMFGVIIGTGCGGGLVINNQLVQGPNAIAGEWGHNPIPWLQDFDLPLQNCYCGKTGCIETGLSGPGLLAYASRSNMKLDSVEELVSLAESNQHAEKLLNEYINRLARSLASVINIVDPEVIVLGGGLSNIDAIYQLIEKEVQSFCFSDQVTTKIRKNIHGDSSGVRGAAWLWN